MELADELLRQGTVLEITFNLFAVCEHIIPACEPNRIDNRLAECFVELLPASPCSGTHLSIMSPRPLRETSGPFRWGNRIFFDPEESVDPLIDELFEKAAKETDRAKFWELMREANRLLAARRLKMVKSGQKPPSSTPAA
jgi:hypothetical protein